MNKRHQNCDDACTHKWLENNPTTDKGWEKELKKVLATIEFDGAKVFECAFPESEAKDEQYEKIKDFIRREIQQKGEEEYKRGRKDAVEFIRRNWLPDMPFDELYIENTLEAVLETQPHD